MTSARGSLLAVDGIDVSYFRRSAALRNVSLNVDAGEIVAILGRNGSGKTTTLRAIGGVLRAEGIRVDKGSIRFKDSALGRMTPHSIRRLGISVVPERDKTFVSLTIEENLMAVPSSIAKPGDLDVVYDLFPNLAQRRKQDAGALSGGERQMLAIGRALVGRPDLLMIDEFSLGLSPILVGRIMDALLGINERLGTAILVVEQNVAAALEMATRAYVLAEGKVVLSGSSEELLASDMVKHAYLGAGPAASEPIL